ncbi:DUF455 family protein [Paenibacillus sp. LMG 31461]|uniref:DUF455 family protein n=1 Tax=Paenibacillus plantarum TaxID=2654975 RepID=A0ABX1X2A3_9BACL|nr:DUF455 family protein [Paenibacillus plantarum]NOU62512.1 DUF455 family protein [Paenibacillus plantarum]
MAQALIMGNPGRMTVDSASEMLKMLYYVERELMRLLGGYLLNVSDWELKKTIPRHMWQDSLRANALRSRVLELRYPRRDVDEGHDQQLTNFLNILSKCANEREFIEGVYFVTKEFLKTRYENYLQIAEPIDDAPTIAFMKRFPEEIAEQLLDVQRLYPQITRRFVAADEWISYLERYVADFSGREEKGQSAQDLSISAEITARPAYVLPEIPARDPKFEKALYHLPPKFFTPAESSMSFIERQVCMAINHVNEMWACEAIGAMVWEWDDMPWEFYLDTARWCYDELRHCLMGEKRLKAWGFEIGVDHAMVADHYISQNGHGALSLLAMIHKFENKAPVWKSSLVTEFTAQGDTASAQDFDYDWADESIHMQYGHKWLSYKLNNDIDAIEDLMEESAERWDDWHAKAKRQWDYEPFLSRITAKIALIESENHE